MSWEGYELSHLRQGHVLVLHRRRYPVIMMWLCRNRRAMLGVYTSVKLG